MLYAIAFNNFILENFEKTKEILNDILKIDSKYIHALELLGYVYVGEEKYKESLKMFRKVLHLDPQNSGGWNGIGLFYFNEGDKIMEAYEVADIAYEHANPLYEKAKVAFEKAVRYNSQNLAILVNFAKILEILRKYKKAFEIHQDVINKDPNILYSLKAIGRHYFREGNLNKSEKYFKEYLKRRPNSSETLYHLSRIHLMRGEFNQAIRLQTKVLEIDPLYDIKILFPEQRNKFWVLK